MKPSNQDISCLRSVGFYPVSLVVWVLLVVSPAVQAVNKMPIKGLDVWVFADSVVQPGSAAQIRVVTKAYTSMSDSFLVPLAQVEITLLDQDREQRLYRGSSDLLGNLQASLIIPNWEPGAYRLRFCVRTLFGQKRCEQSIVLRRRARIWQTTDRQRYQPGQAIKLRVLVLEQKSWVPIADQTIQVVLRNPQGAVEHEKNLNTDSYGLALWTSPALTHSGKYTLETNTKKDFEGQNTISFLAIDKTQTARSVTTLQATALAITLQPEGHQLAREVSNRIFINTLHQPGNVPAQAIVNVYQKGSHIAKVTTDEYGVGSFRFTPSASDKVTLLLVAQDKSTGKKTSVLRNLSCQEEKQIWVSTNRSIYQNQDWVRALFVANDANPIYFDLLQDQQTLANYWVYPTLQRADLEFRLPKDVSGLIRLTAYQLDQHGHPSSTSRYIYVHPANQLNILVKRDRIFYHKLQKAQFRFQVLDQQGNSVPAVLGVHIAPMAKYPNLALIQRPLAALMFSSEQKAALQDEWIADIVYSAPDEGLQQRARFWFAKLIDQKSREFVNPQTERKRKADLDYAAIRQSLLAFNRKQTLWMRSVEGEYRYVPGLVDAILSKHKDPLDMPYTQRTMESLWPDLRAQALAEVLEKKRLVKIRDRVYAVLLELISKGSSPIKDVACDIACLEKYLPMALRNVADGRSKLVRDLTNQPYDAARLRNLPGFRLQDVIEFIHTNRVQNIYAALDQYGRLSEKWYRLSVLDPIRDVYILPDRVLVRLVRRGLLADWQAKDVWNRDFHLVINPDFQSNTTYHRLRYYSVHSAGEDGVYPSEDDLVYTQGHKDLIKSEESVTRKDAKEVFTPLPPQEILATMPEVYTDTEGWYELNQVFPKQTTFRILIVAHSAEGGLGSVVHQLTIQPTR